VGSPIPLLAGRLTIGWALRALSLRRPAAAAPTGKGEDLQTIVSLIAATTNAGGLRVKAKLDRRAYQAGISIRKATMKRLRLDHDTFHGEWNYSIRPRLQSTVL
jgi:hypothetical protein